MTTTQSSRIIEHMSDTTTTERKPPTLADIVREKTDDGRRIIDFFLDVMEARVEGAELCHRIDTAKQLVKYGSKDAARFIARYRDVSCGHSTRGRRDPADPCSTADAAGQENAPGPFTEDLLTVLSAVDEDLLARLVRAQTADGFTVVEFLDDVMQDRVDGFKPHHRIAAAKELIVHIVRDEAPDSVHPEPVEGSAHPELVEGPVLSTVEGSAHPELVEGPVLSTVEGSAHPELVEGPVLSTVEGSVHPELVEGPVLSTVKGSKGPLTLSLSKGPFTLSLSKGPLTLSLSKGPFTLSLSKGPLTLSLSKGPLTLSLSKGPLTLSLSSFPRPAQSSFPRRREPIPLTLDLSKDPRTEYDGPQGGGPENNAAGTEPPGPPCSESTQAPSATSRKGRTIRPPWSSP